MLKPDKGFPYYHSFFFLFEFVLKKFDRIVTYVNNLSHNLIPYVTDL